jgi:outer membrane immunogenic protein
MFVRSLALAAAASLSLALAANANGWGGYYMGFNAGLGTGEAETERTITNNSYFAPSSIPALEAASDMELEEETFAGGVQLGMNWPFGAHAMIGFEADVQGFGNDTSGGRTVTYPCCAPSTFTTTNSIEQAWFTTARVRIGFGGDWLMLYATGGFAGADITLIQTFSDTDAPIAVQTLETSDFRTGYAMGGGAEVMIEPGTSLKFEYLLLDLGDITTVGPIATGTTTSNGRAEVRDRILRVGLNFQID